MPTTRARFDQLWQREEERVGRWALRLTGNADDAADLVQGSYIRALGSSEHFVEGLSFSAWLYAVVHSEHVDQKRRQARARAESFEAVRASDQGSNLKRLQAKTEESETLQKVLRSLSGDHRRLLVLKLVVGLDFHELAQAEKVKEPVVRYRYRCAREAAAKAFEAA